MKNWLVKYIVKGEFNTKEALAKGNTRKAIKLIFKDQTSQLVNKVRLISITPVTNLNSSLFDRIDKNQPQGFTNPYGDNIPQVNISKE